MPKPLILLTLICQMVYSQQMITNMENRKTVSLNGKWNYIVDPYETGFYNYRRDAYEDVDKNSHAAFYNNYHAEDKNELVEYDIDQSPTLDVPGDWNSQKENLLYYEGTVWMKKSFDYDLPEGRRLFVSFSAVNYKADVYLNGTKLGTHEGGFTPFSFEITKLVKKKDNFLVVRVNNNRSKEAVPTLNTDWWNYGGITRDVLLADEPATFIQDYTLQLSKNKNHMISGFVQLYNATKPEKISIEIPELNIKKTFNTDPSGKAVVEFEVKGLSYWSPENPKLYKVIVSTEEQSLADDIGFRTIETKGPKILLNGQPVFLKGISIHEENALKGARAFSEEDDLQSLKWAKELGCNYVRLAHYPHNEKMLKLADKMGLMVWEEIPVYWTIHFTSLQTLSNAKNQLTEAITRDKNRACIIIWSMANETPVSATRNKFITTLITHARALDNTRLISAALETHDENGVSVVNDSLGNSLDIIAFNEYWGWYVGSVDDITNTKWRVDFDKPVIISEFGGGAKAGLHGSKTERWTEEYQAYLYEQNIKMIEQIPHYSGMSPWILADFRSPKRLLPGIQDGYNRKGLISDKGVKKMAFYVLQRYYSEKK